jgi:hypothetical protein
MNNMVLKTKHGDFIARSFEADNENTYTGMAIEFVSNEDNGQYDGRPCVRLEFDKSNTDTNSADLQTLIYDSSSEDSIEDVNYTYEGYGYFSIKNSTENAILSPRVLQQIRDAYASNLDVLHEMGDDDGSEDTHESGYKAAIEFIARLASFDLT